jgi:hypothetical protein
MKYILTLLVRLWCAYRRTCLYLCNAKDKRSVKGWYGYDVQDLRKQQYYSFYNRDHTWFQYRKYYESDNYELVRRLRIFHYLVVISYYKHEGFHKELGLKTPAEMESDKIVNLFNYKNQVYTYHHLQILGDEQGDINVQK